MDITIVFLLMNRVMIFTVLPKCHERKQYSQQLITEYVYIWLSIERVNSRGTRKELPLRTWLKEIAPAQLQDRLLYLHHQLRADRQPITLYEI